MQRKAENKLLFLIKIVPILIILSFTIINMYLAITQNSKEHQTTVETLKTELIQKSKQRAKDEVINIYNLITYQKSTTEKKLKVSIKQRVYEAHAIITRIYNENKHKTKAEVLKLIKDALRDIRFNNGRGYYFVYEMNGKVLLLPTAPQLEGTSMWNFKDAKDTYTIRGMSNLVKQNGEGFYSWYWYKPDNKQTQYRKIGFGKYFEPYNLFIGTGEYIKDFEEDLKEDLIDRINAIRYSQDGYVFMFQYNGMTLSHINKEYLGKNLYDIEDKNGNKYVQKVINTAKKGEGFLEYIAMAKPTTGEPAPKISYIKGFDEWEWALGAGVYVDDINKLIEKNTQQLDYENKQEIKRIILFNIILAGIFIIISFFIVKGIQRVFLNYKNSMENIHRKLQEQKNEFEQLFAHSPIPFAFAESDGNISKRNSSFIQTFGYDEKLVPDIQTWYEKAYPDQEYRDKIIKQWEQLIHEANAKDKIVAPMEVNIIDNEGNEHYVIIKSIVFNEGVLATFFDLTKQKYAEEALTKKTNQLIGFLDSTTDFLWEIDREGKYTYISKRSETILGYEPEELIGKSPFDLMDENERKRVSKLFKNILENEKLIINLENWNITKNGERACLLTNGRPIYDENHNCIGYRGADKDITEFKLQAGLLLEQSKLAAMGNMIANIAHQWRQPLSVISTGATGVKFHKEYGILTDEYLYETLDDINKSTQYLSQTIDTFRDFIKEDKEYKEVILQDRIDKALQVVESSLKNNYITIINNIDYKTPIPIKIVVGELSQVIINILNNAKDALVEHQEKDRWVKLDLEKKEQKIIITIEDNGGGIPNSILPHIFEPYFTTKHQSQGTGLGLHMSYKIITESLHGKLYVKNSEVGAKFFIELPK